MKRIACLSLALAALVLAACGNPETQCREGYTRMKARLTALTTSGESRAPADVQLHEEAQGRLLLAQQQFKAGDYPACIESVSEAGALINRSMRTNQQ